MILSSKSFNVPKNESIPYEQIQEWVNCLYRGDLDCRLVVRLEVDENRQKKRPAKLVLEYAVKELVKNSSPENAVDAVSWYQGEYRFLFLLKQYYWKGKEIYLTPNEQLFLFQWLVTNDVDFKSQWFFLRNIRKRLGNEFLSDEKKEDNNDNS